MSCHRIIRLATWLTCIGIVFGSAPATAQQHCEEPSDLRYVNLMSEARAAVAEEDYAAALERFREAARVSDFVLIDYAMARAYHMLERYAAAEAEYERFLDRNRRCDDPHQLAALALGYLDEVQAARELAAIEPESVEDVTVPPDDPAEPSPVETGPETSSDSGGETEPVLASDYDSAGGIEPGWVFVASGGALVTAAIIYDLVNADLVNQRQAAYDAGDLDEFNEIDEAISRGRWVDGMLYGVGAVAIGTGVVLLIIGDDEPQTPALGVSPSRGGAMLTYGGRF